MSFLDGIINVGKEFFGGGTGSSWVDVGVKLGKEYSISYNSFSYKCQSSKSS